MKKIASLRTALAKEPLKIPDPVFENIKARVESSIFNSLVEREAEQLKRNQPIMTSFPNGDRDGLE